MTTEEIVIAGYANGTPIRELEVQAGVHKSSIKRIAKRLGLSHPGRFGGNGIITKDEHSQESKMQKATQADLNALREHCEQHGLPFDSRRLWWHKTPQFSVSFYDEKQVADQQKAQEEFLARIKKAAPKIKKSPVPTKTLAIPANFDVHIGKHCQLIRTGNNYTPDIAINQVLQGQDALFQMTKPFGVSDILLPMGNDIIHIDNNQYTSTAGTPQDSYGSVESQMMLAAELYIRSIEGFAQNHNVWLCHVSSNHDRVSGWAVSQMVAQYFHNHPRVHCHADSMNQVPLKYFIFGNTLIIFTHGEIKEEKLLGTIKHEVGAAWAMIEHIVCYTGHRHHKEVNQRGAHTIKEKEKDHTAVTVIKAGAMVENLMHVEMVRSPSPADSWHKNSAYNNLPAVEMFLHNERSQFARFTHFF